MSIMLLTGTVTMRLEADCKEPSCNDLARRLLDQLGTANYSLGASVMQMYPSVGAWRFAHRTARKRADRAQRLGYRFEEIDRSQFNDDIHAINTSKDRRQGRPMAPGYLERHNHGPLPDYPCDRHRIHTYGVLNDGFLSEPHTRLVAYLTLYRCGEFGMISMILGHGDHLQNDIMYLLAQGTIAAQVRHGGYLFYNRHDSGTDGLRFYKERLGFRERDIEWVL